MRRGPWHAWLVTPLILLSGTLSLRAQSPPADLPRYDLHIVLDVARRQVAVKQSVVWTNTSALPVHEIVFNAHAHFSIPDKDVGRLAKMAEILRLAPKEALSLDGPALHIDAVRYRGVRTKSYASFYSLEPAPNRPIAHYFPEDNATSLHIPLPDEVKPGESVTLDLDFHLKLPQRKGRWGQWDGITTLAQWLPVVAVHDDVKGWQPAPFIPWHQPYFNEAGHYTVKVRLPVQEKLAASSSVRSESITGDGWKDIEFDPICVRDFALISSARFEEWHGAADGVKIRCLAPPEHAFYAKAFIEAAEQAIPTYNQWFGRYPYPQFTIVESSFGWAGNECGGLVMIDDRMFNMPHIAKQYPVYLLQHELCHQWWYNVVGTNGYAETWMDEGLATYFSHRLADRTFGRNNELLDYPKGLHWLPNIRRGDLRNYSMIGVWARGEAHPCVQDMPQYDHLVNLTAATYDRGSKVVGMIEERLGEPAFLDLMRHIYRKYQFRILRVADFRRELEAYTGHAWDEFFAHWVYGTGRCDWSVQRVEINEEKTRILRVQKPRRHADPLRVVVYLEQRGDFNEPTTLGIRLQDGNDYQMRVPIHPDVPLLQLPDFHAVVTSVTEISGGKSRACVRVEIALPSEPLQISIDPDHMLLDARPTNNHWKREFRWRMTPFYTQLDEVDVANAYDRWNINAGPWAYFASYNDPWYNKSLMGGVRVGLFRTQELQSAGFLAYRSNDRNIVAGADFLWDHVPLKNVQLGLYLEKSIATVSNTDIPTSRGVLFARYILLYGSSLYLPPFEYVETFGVVQNRSLPNPSEPTPGTDLFRDRAALGIHYHKNMMTPYWDAEGGYAFDMTYQYGLPIFGNQREFHEAYGQFAFVKGLGKLRELWGDGAIRNWLAETRLAFRLGGAAALPNNGLFFALGGGDNFRGFELSERQGNLLWIGSVEWRIPLRTNMHSDFVDHFAGIRNIYAAPFYDVGNAYVKGHQLGPVAHAVGAGLRVDVTWLGLIERTTMRFDVAKSVAGNYPVQFWFGIQHPF